MKLLEVCYVKWYSVLELCKLLRVKSRKEFCSESSFYAAVIFSGIGNER